MKSHCLHEINNILHPPTLLSPIRNCFSRFLVYFFFKSLCFWDYFPHEVQTLPDPSSQNRRSFPNVGGESEAVRALVIPGQKLAKAFAKNVLAEEFAFLCGFGYLCFISPLKISSEKEMITLKDVLCMQPHLSQSGFYSSTEINYFALKEEGRRGRERKQRGEGGKKGEKEERMKGQRKEG